MKHKGYQLLSVLFAFVWLCLCVKLAMARHIGHRHIQEGCFRCPPGYGVTHRCSRDYDTVCTSCKPGHHYSSHHSSRRPCYPCSLCGVGLYVAHACTPTKDTVCDSCKTYKGPHNQDFYKRCVQPIIPTNSSVTPDRQPHDVQQTINALLRSVQNSKGFPPWVVVAAAVVTSAMIVIMVVTLCISNSRRHSKMVLCGRQILPFRQQSPVRIRLRREGAICFITLQLQQPRSDPETDRQFDSAFSCRRRFEWVRKSEFSYQRWTLAQSPKRNKGRLSTSLSSRSSKLEDHPGSVWNSTPPSKVTIGDGDLLCVFHVFFDYLDILTAKCLLKNYLCH